MLNVTEPPKQDGHWEDSLPPSDGVVAFSFVLWTITIVVGVLGNGLMGAAIGYTASLRTAMNTYLLSIGLIDFLTCALLLPLRVYVEKRAHAGEASASHLMGAELFIRTFTDISRLLLMQSLSIERYQAIARPFLVSKIQARRRAVAVSVVIAVISAVISALSVRYFCDTVLHLHCRCRKPGEASRNGDLEVYIEIPLTFLSVLAIAVSYSLIVMVLRQQTNKLNQHSVAKYKANQIQPVAEDVVKTPYLGGEGARITLSPKHNDGLSTKPVREATKGQRNMKSDQFGISDSSNSKHGDQSETRMRNDMDNLEQGCSYVKLYDKSLEDLQCERTGSTSVDTAASVSESSSIVAVRGSNEAISKTEHVVDIIRIQPSLDELSKLNVAADVTVSPESELLSPECVGIKPMEVSQGGTYVPRHPQYFTTPCHQPRVTRPISHESNLGDFKSGLSSSTHQNPGNASKLASKELGIGAQDSVFTCNWSSNESMNPGVYKHTNHRRASFHNLPEKVTSSSNQPKDSLLSVSTENGAHSLPQSTLNMTRVGNADDADLLKHSKLKGSLLRRSISDVSGLSTTSTIISKSSSFLYTTRARRQENKYISTLVGMLQQFNFSTSQNPSDKENTGTETAVREMVLKQEQHRQLSVESQIQNDAVDRGEVLLKFDPRATKEGPWDGSPKKSNVLPVMFDKVSDIVNGVSSKCVQNSSATDQSVPATLKAAVIVPPTECSVGIKCSGSEKTPEATQVTDQNSAEALTSPKDKINVGKMVEVVEMDGTVRVEMLKADTSAGQIEGAVCLMNPKNREQGRRRVELKAALKVGLLFCCFVCLWMPLPIFVLVLRETSGWGDTVKIDMLFVFSALATSTAAVDPIIYGLLNNQIRSAAIVVMKKLRRKTLERFRHDI